MQTVGAQWLVDVPIFAVLVSLVQAATTLPVMLLALPGGALADTFDRRWLLFMIQVYFSSSASCSLYSPPQGRCRRPR
jgi:MFS family permease